MRERDRERKSWSPGVERLEKILLFLQHKPGILLDKPVRTFPCHPTGSSSLWIAHRYHVVSLKDQQQLLFVVICNYSAMRVLFLLVSLKRRCKGRFINPATQFLTIFRESRLASSLLYFSDTSSRALCLSGLLTTDTPPRRSSHCKNSRSGTSCRCIARDVVSSVQ